jgi:hypothetical protein
VVAVTDTPRVTITSLDGTPTIVSLDRAGQLYCDTHATIWCSDIEQVLRDNLDTESLWSDPYYTDKTVSIPILPSHSLWNAVRLDRVNNLRAYSVTQLGMKGDRDDFVGFIHPGEGRRVVRNMLFEWFNQVKVNLTCPSEHHRFAQQRAFENNLREPKTRMAEQWCLWGYRMCLSCVAASASPVGGFSDLVPGEEPVGPRPRFPERPRRLPDDLPF